MYCSTVDQPTLTGMNYTDITDDDSTSTLAIITCDTRNVQPKNVTWLRNGNLLHIDRHNYEITQQLQNRESSEYSNSLLIRDVIGLIHSPTYACKISSGNISLTSSIVIHISLEGNLCVALNS